MRNWPGPPADGTTNFGNPSVLPTRSDQLTNDAGHQIVCVVICVTKSMSSAVFLWFYLFIYNGLGVSSRTMGKAVAILISVSVLSARVCVAEPFLVLGLTKSCTDRRPAGWVDLPPKNAVDASQRADFWQEPNLMGFTMTSSVP